jgi:thioredoxin 1
MALQVTDANFDELVNSGKPMVLDFWAEWCGPCRMIAPTVKEIAAEQDGNLSVAKMDIDSNPMIPGRYSIMSIPTLMLFKDGEVVARFTGVRPKDQIMAQVAPHL